MIFVDYYSILEISEAASKEEVVKAFRELAKKYHPDKNKAPNASDKFREVFEAYKILKDEESRKFFDFKRAKYHKTTNTDIFSVNYTAEDFSSDKEQARKTADECSKMAFDDFIKSSLFIIKKSTINFAIILMLIFGVFMIGFSFFILAKIDNLQVGIGAMTFSLILGGTLVYIAQKDFKKENSK